MQRRCDRRFRYNLKPKPALISWRSLQHALRHRLRRRRGRWRQGQRYTCAGAYHLEDDTVVDEPVRISIPADDLVRSVDSIERSKRRARLIIDQKTIRRHKEDAVRRAPCIAVTPHHEIPVVIAE